MTQSVTFTQPRRGKAAAAVLAIGLIAFAPAAYAQGPAERGDRQMQRGEHQHASRDQMRGHGMGHRMGGQRGGNMLLGLGCGPNAAQRIEHALVSLTYRIEATDDQKALIDDLKSTALAAQAEFAEVCQTVLPQGAAMGGMPGGMMDDEMAPPAMGEAPEAPPAPEADAMAAAPEAAPAPDAPEAPAAGATRPNMLEMMQARLKLEEARVAALGEVLPKFEALYNALSDEQKASLEPMRGQRGMHGDHGPQKGHRNGRNG